MTDDDVLIETPTPDPEAVADDADEDLDEADIAADYIEGLLDICDLDGDIEIKFRYFSI